MCGVTGASLRCREIGNSSTGDDLTVLAADLSVPCTGSGFTLFSWIDFLLMIFYCIGIPLLFFLILWKNREILEQRPVEQEIPEEIEYCSALCRSYERSILLLHVPRS